MAKPTPPSPDVLQALEHERAVEVLKRKVSEQERLIGMLHRQLDGLKKSRFELPTQKHRKSNAKMFVRVIVPDTHGCYVDPPAIGAFFDDLKELAPSEVILLGDHLDCGGFLAEHWTLGYVAETAYTFADDASAASQFLDRVQSHATGASIDYLYGNHEQRIERFCVTAALKNAMDAKFFLDRFSVETTLSLKERGIRYYTQGERYDGLAVPGTIKRGHCYFTHGHYTGRDAGRKHLVDLGGNVVFGHIHRAESYVTRNVHTGVIGAWCPGALCLLQRYWNHTRMTGWSHGYGVQIVSRDTGEFLHINCPIIDGRSYLFALVNRRT